MRQGLPEAGTPWHELEAEMRALAASDVDWRRGRTAVYVFNAGEEVHRVGREAYAMFMAENGLGLRAFPSLKRMEEEVVGFGLSLLHAPPDAAGDMTSGGTESIAMAMKACRDWWRARGRPTDGGEVVAPRSAHPAFDKAAHMLGLTVVRTPLGADLRADPQAMAEAVGERTLMLVGSAPCFPYGLIDPIEEIAALARERGLWMHVDACVGGYFIPFAAMNGVAIEPFDFAVEGVWSMSADLHKYGYAPKGASTVLYRSAEMRACQVFDVDVWPNGRMTTPTMAGTRPGGAIAAAWAVMRHLGIAGYREKAAQVVAARRAVQEGVTGLGFRALGEPRLGLLAFGDPSRDVLAVADAMRERGWVSSRVAAPDGIHLMLSPAHVDFVADYLEDLAAATAETAAAGRRSDGRGFYA